MSAVSASDINNFIVIPNLKLQVDTNRRRNENEFGTFGTQLAGSQPLTVSDRGDVKSIN